MKDTEILQEERVDLVLNMPAELRQRIKDYADELGDITGAYITMTEVILAAVEHYLEAE